MKGLAPELAQSEVLLLTVLDVAIGNTLDALLAQYLLSERLAIAFDY